jgi:hypothetical protein
MMDRFLAWADRRHLVSVRTATLGVTVWMTWRVTEWAFLFSNAWLAAGKSGVDAALIIGAVTAPLTALQTYTFKFYMGEKAQ